MWVTQSYPWVSHLFPSSSVGAGGDRLVVLLKNCTPLITRHWGSVLRTTTSKKNKTARVEVASNIYSCTYKMYNARKNDIGWY